MINAIDRWVQSHRYHVIIRQLKSLSEPELAALGIAPSQIEHLALEASQADAWKPPPRWARRSLALMMLERKNW